MSKINNQTRQGFLHTFFDKSVQYDEKEVNGYWLVKHLVNGGPATEVAIFTPGKFQRYKFQAGQVHGLGIQPEPVSVPQPTLNRTQ